MKKIVGFIFCALMLFTIFSLSACAETKNENLDNSKTIVMEIDNPQITINNESKNIDDNNTAPTIINGRTFIPIRALMEAFNGEVQWDNATRTATLTYNNNEVKLTVDSTTAYFNNNSVTLDVAPVIINGRTMLPVRFVAESFGFNVNWNSENRTITISNTKETSTEETSAIIEETTAVAENATKTGSKSLVVYFSCTGNTEEVANKIANVTGSDVYKIEALNPYTSDDLNYNNDNCRANKEQNDDTARPEIKGTIDNLSDYDTIFIGYPIWWGNAPKIIYTFMESYDFSGKTIIPFCTSGSSGIATSENTIKSLAPNADFIDGKRFNSSVTEETIKEWLTEIEK